MNSTNFTPYQIEILQTLVKQDILTAYQEYPAHYVRKVLSTLGLNKHGKIIK